MPWKRRYTKENSDAHYLKQRIEKRLRNWKETAGAHVPIVVFHTDPFIDRLDIDVDLDELAARPRSATHIEAAQVRIKQMLADPNIQPIETSFRAYDKNGQLLVSYLAVDPLRVKELKSTAPNDTYEELCQKARELDSSHSPMTVRFTNTLDHTDSVTAGTTARLAR